MPLRTPQNIPEYLWTDRPAPASIPGKVIRIMDVGHYGGVLYYSNGIEWVAQMGYTLFQSGVPVGIPSSGSIGNNGALTMNTGINSPTPTAGQKMFLYFPANAIFAGSAAGLYYTELSNSTTGVIYNNTHGYDNTYPASPTPFVTTGPGAYTQVTTDILIHSTTVKGGLLSKNGSISVVGVSQFPNNANNKTTKFKYGGATVYSNTSDTGNYWVSRSSVIQAMNSTSAQVSQSNVGGTALIHSSINSANDQTMQLTLAIVNTADYLICRRFSVSIS